MEEREASFADPPTTAPPLAPPPLPRAVVTPVVVGVCIVASVLAFATDMNPLAPTTGHLVAWGANFGPLATVEGQWWRLLTCAFLHGGWIHLAVNMWVLWGMGPSCERALGRGAFALVYLTAALGGSLASLAWRPLGVSVGASGAIFGIVGGYLAFLHRLRGSVDGDTMAPLRGNLLSFVAYNLFIGAALPFVDNAAHLGGLVTGGVMSLLLGAPRFRESAGPWARLGVPAALAVAVLAALAVAARQRVLATPEVVASLTLERGQEAFSKGRYDEALAEFDRAVKLSRDDPGPLVSRASVHSVRGDHEAATKDAGSSIKLRDGAPARTLRGWAFLSLGKPDLAARDFEQAVKLDPRSTQPLVGLARTRALQGRISEAWPLYAKALALSPENVFILGIRASALQHAGRLDEAMADLDRAVRLAPQEAKIHNNRAWVLRIMGRLEESLRAADQAVALDPKSPHAIGTRCWTRFGKGDRDGALADCREAVSLKPDLPLDIGMIRFMEGDRAGAATLWEEALAAGEETEAALAPWLEEARRISPGPSRHAPGS